MWKVKICQNISRYELRYHLGDHSHSHWMGENVLKICWSDHFDHSSVWRRAIWSCRHWKSWLSSGKRTLPWYNWDRAGGFRYREETVLIRLFAPWNSPFGWFLSGESNKSPYIKARLCHNWIYCPEIRVSLKQDVRRQNFWRKKTLKKAYLDHLNSPMLPVAGWSGKLDGPSFPSIVY